MGVDCFVGLKFILRTTFSFCNKHIMKITFRVVYFCCVLTTCNYLSFLQVNVPSRLMYDYRAISSMHINLARINSKIYPLSWQIETFT